MEVIIRVSDPEKAEADLKASNLAVIQRASTGTCANRNETPCRCWRPF